MIYMFTHNAVINRKRGSNLTDIDTSHHVRVRDTRCLVRQYISSSVGQRIYWTLALYAQEPHIS